MRSPGTSVVMKNPVTPVSWPLASWRFEDGSCWLTAVACAVFEAAAVALLLPGTPLLGAPRGVATAALHLTAALLVAAGPIPQSSRRWLSAAAVLAVPCVGAVVAAAVLGTSGRGPDAAGRGLKSHRPRALTVAAARRLGQTLSPPDALDRGDEEQRRAALLGLVRRSDAEGVTLLRWAASGRDPDLTLLAALALDEIRERAQAPAPRIETQVERAVAPALRAALTAEVMEVGDVAP